MRTNLFVLSFAVMASLFSCTNLSLENKKDRELINALNAIPSEQIPGSKADNIPLTKGELSASAEIDALSFDVLELIGMQADGRSFIFSPLSMQYALGMFANTVMPQKRADFVKSCFGERADIDMVNSMCKKYISILPAIDLESELSVANLALTMEGMQAVDADEGIYREVFQSPFVSCNFNDVSVQARLNDWVSSHTRGRIEGFFKEGSATGALLAFYNALSFSAKWSPSFSSCGKELFYAAEPVKLRTIAANYYGKYYDGGNTVIVSIPLGSEEKFNLAVMMATDSAITTFDAQAIKDGWNAFRDINEHQPIALKIPEFSISNSIDITSYLHELGISSDPDGLVRLRDKEQDSEMSYRLDYMQQKLCIDVNTHGIEFASASNGGINPPVSTGPDDSFNDAVAVVINRPFLFFVYEETSGVKLLSGCFTGKEN